MFKQLEEIRKYFFTHLGAVSVLALSTALLIGPTPTFAGGDDDDDDALLTAIPREVPLQGVDSNSGAFGDFFGNHMCSDGNWLVVTGVRTDLDLDESGTRGDAPGETAAGAVHVYRRLSSGDLDFVQTIEAKGNNVVAFGDRFGSGCSVVGNELFINVANDNSYDGIDPFQDPDFPPFSFAGQVNVYQLNEQTGTWDDEPAQRLISDLPGSSRAFGSRTNSNTTVVITKGSGDDKKAKLVVVSEPPNGIPSVGKLHVFAKKQDEWKRVQIVSPADSIFGSITVIRNKYIAVTERLPFDQEPTADYRTRVLIYKVRGNRLGEEPVQALVEPRPEGELSCDVTLETGFGTSMASGGDVLMLGDACANNFGGAMYVYRLKGEGAEPLKLIQILEAPAGTFLYGTVFGAGKQGLGVSGDGKILIVGTADVLRGGNPEEDVDIYQKQGDLYVLAESLPNPEPSDPVINPFGKFWGMSVHLLTPGDGPDLAISASGLVGDNEGAGRVFLYDFDQEDDD